MGKLRIALYSDLHLEMMMHPKGRPTWAPPALAVDVVILAGDIDSHTHGIDWAGKAFCQTPEPPAIIYIPGNHEYYGKHHQALTADMRKVAKRAGVHFLENDTIEIAGVRFLGTALWSDFMLYGTDEEMICSIHTAKHEISDFSAIFRADGKFIEPQDAIKLHLEARDFLGRELAKPFEGKTVVVTHFSPHRGCVAAQFEGGPLTPYFTVDMSPLMRQHKIELWAFGHTHHNVDFIESGCRVVSNQRGYPRDGQHGFRKDLIIEITI